MATSSPSLVRQRWLEDGTAALRRLFILKGYKVPDTVRVSIGWPHGSGGRRRAIGQCWEASASTDKHNEVFISPEITSRRNGIRILGVLAHELAHAAVGVEHAHKAPFKRCAEAIGLTGKVTATTEGPEFTEWAKKVLHRIGDFPGGALSLATKEKKQTTRLLKCECESCGYVARVTRKWIDDAGAPICPTDQEPLRCDATDDEEED